MSQPPTAPPAAAGAAAPPPDPPPWRTALTEGLATMRAAARTEPGRLRMTGAAVAALLVLFGAVTAWQTSGRSSAADHVLASSQPLSAAAAGVYRSLADANTTATAAFLAGSEEEPAVMSRYADDIGSAARLLAEAAARGEGTGESQRLIETLSQELPRYTGLVETARAINRQGLPLGGAYLRYADELMQELLSLADRLYALESARLRQDVDQARSWPWLALAAGTACLAVLAWAQLREYRRTNRVFNPGLLAATAAAAALLVWLAGSHAVARTHLNEARNDAAASLSVLTDAWAEALQARGDENMVLVARGAGEQFEDSYAAHMADLAGPSGGAEDTGEDAGLLGRAADLAGDDRGRQWVENALRATGEWRDRHQEAREQERLGDYDGAVERVTGGQGSTRESFDQVDDALEGAVGHEQERFERAATGGRDALDGLSPAAALALAALGALAAVLGIGSRLSEYR